MATTLNTSNSSSRLLDEGVSSSAARRVLHSSRSRQLPGDSSELQHVYAGARALKMWAGSQIKKLLHPFAQVNVSFEDMALITFDAIGDAVLVVDSKGDVIYLNKMAETLTGWSRENALGHSIDQVFLIVDGVTRQRAISPAQRAIDGQAVKLSLGSVLIRRDGSDIAIEDSSAPIHNRLGQMSGAVIVFHHAHQSEHAIQKMSHLAQHDTLTGLPNRLLLIERLTHAIGMAKRNHKQLALLFLDLDHFKQINDSFGHAIGDRLLREVAANIVGCVRTTDTGSRHGGDEFVILLTEIDKRRDAALIAKKMLAKFATPHVIDGHELAVTLSIGISVYPEDGDDADTLMHQADAAMYSAKKAGRNNYQFCPQAYKPSRKSTKPSMFVKNSAAHEHFSTQSLPIGE